MPEARRPPGTLVLAAAALLAVWCTFAGCRRESGPRESPSSPPASAAPTPRRNPLPITHPCTLVVWIGTNLEGELEPCGCVEGMMGGLARRATVARGDEPTSAVEVGQCLTPRTASNRASTQLREKDRVILRALGRMGWTAALPGPEEDDLALQASAGARTAKMEGAAPALLSGRGSRVDEVARPGYPPLRVGLIWLAADVFESEDLRGWLRAEIERTPADTWILLTHLPASSLRALLGAVPSIRIVVTSHPGVPTAAPERVGSAWIAHAGRKGQFLGRFEFTWPASPSGNTMPATFRDTSEALHLRRLRREYEAALAQADQTIAAPIDPAERYRLGVERERIQKSLSGLPEAVPAAPGEATVTSELIPLDRRVAEEPEVRRMVQDYIAGIERMNAALTEEDLRRDWLTEQGRTAADFASAPKYRGPASCKGCHPAEHARWSETRHAGAFKALEATHQTMDLECIGCHTIGHREWGGYFAPREAVKFANVSCETCHGPAGDHPEGGKYAAKEIAVETCLKCHTADIQPAFDFAGSLQRATCQGK
ncbi:MAG: hypothetical protein HYY93_08110 [Planctomycetes bacterium]|nr:hypothetical protein [Planctomycetota bacterium]